MTSRQQSDEGRKKFSFGVGPNVTKDFGPFLTLGLQLAISVVVFFFIGYWLDGKWGTSPWLTIGGAFLGAAGGLVKFIRAATELGKKADANMKRKTTDGQDRG